MAGSCIKRSTQLIEIYKVIENEGEVKFERVIPKFGVSKDNNHLAILSCPGANGYHRVIPALGVSIKKLA